VPTPETTLAPWCCYCEKGSSSRAILCSATASSIFPLSGKILAVVHVRLCKARVQREGTAQCFLHELLFVKSTRQYASLHGDPRYADLLRRMRLPQ
jgi:hypothetical protein